MTLLPFRRLPRRVRSWISLSHSNCMSEHFSQHRALLMVLALAVPTAVSAQAPLPDLSLEELMALDAGQVFGASERLQPVTEAPASVSFITADEIARFGYRTLADILRGVRGMYVSDDRNFSLVGVRGFGNPGDYNSRILLLVNGHRVNDNVFGQAEVGAEFGMDPATFERVEIIRGPASSIYGDSAFFAVVNVITKSGASMDGSTVMIEAGSLGTRRARGTFGRVLANGVDVAASATYEQSTGVGRLYFPAFDAPDTNFGVAENLDGERLAQFYGKLSYKSLTLTAAYGTRRRTVPTASFDTVFNEQDNPEQTTDRHTLLDAEYVRMLGETRLALRASFDRFTYDGRYPFAADEAGDPPRIGAPSVNGVRWTGGVRATRPLGRRQTLTAGVEFIDNVHQDQLSQYLNPPELFLDLDRRSQQTALYLQDEVKFMPWLIGTFGVRYDGYEQFDRVTPRAALIAMPSPTQSYKYLYGNAFRAPNAYELNEPYFGSSVRDSGAGDHRHPRGGVGAVHWRLVADIGVGLLVSCRPADHPGTQQRTGRLLPGHLREPGGSAGPRPRVRGAGATVARLAGLGQLRAAAGGRSGHRRRPAQLAAQHGEGAADPSRLYRQVAPGGGGPVHRPAPHAVR